MLDIGWSEMLVIAVVAIVIIGPKDLPRTLRIVGRWIGKARAMAREFQNSLDDIARESELDEIKKQIKEVSDFDIRGEIEHSFDAPATEAGAGDGGAPSAPAKGEATAATEEAGAQASPAGPEPRDQAPATAASAQATADDADDAPKSETRG
jgi:sec-independent protein translocase protein TatB